MTKAGKPPYTSYNPYFIIPFLLWAAAGSVLFLAYDKKVLFSAVNTHHTAFLDTVMIHITRPGEGYTIVLVLLVLMGAYVYRSLWYFLTALACNAVPALAVQAIKRTMNMPRPLNFFQEASWVHILPEWPRLFHYSFPSGHSAGAFSLFCFLSLLLSERYRAFGILFFILALLTAYSRMYLAAHFYADVFAGSIIGTVTTLLCYTGMKRTQPRFFSEAA